MLNRALVLLLAASLAGPALAGGNANFVLGERRLGDNTFWDPTTFEGQTVFGANVDFGGEDWPVQLCGGLNISGDSSGDYYDVFFDFWDDDIFNEPAAAVIDASFGFKWIGLKERPFHPYVGGGLSSVVVVLETQTDDDGDGSLGYYGNAGFYWRLGKRLNIGVDLRVVRGTEFDLFLEGASTGKFDADYEQFGLLFGFGW